MKKVLLVSLITLALAAPAFAQQAREFEIDKVAVEFILTPEYQFTGSQRRSDKLKWMEIEVEFHAKPEFTDELVFNYYVLFAKRLFVAQVNHVNIQKGRDL